MIESFAEMFEASLKGGQSMQSGTIVNAKVLAVKPDVVIVDAGLKSEGVIPLVEFMVDGEIKVAVGDDVEWVVLCSEGYTSSLAAASLQELGLHRATDVIGGYHALKAVLN